MCFGVMLNIGWGEGEENDPDYLIDGNVVNLGIVG